MRYRPDGGDCLLPFNTCKIEWPCSEESSWKEFVLLKERLGNFLFIWLKNLLLTTSKCLFWVTEGLTKSIDLICQESASASTKPKASLRSWLSLFEVHQMMCGVQQR